MPGDDDTRDEDEPGWAAPDVTSPGAPPPAPPAPAPPASAPPSAAWQAPPPGEVPAPGPLPPPTGRPRRIWLFMLAALLGVGLLAGIAGTVLFVDRTVPPYDAAKEFLDDLGAGRRDEAVSQLCAADRESSEAAISEVTQTFQGGRRILVNPLTVDRDDDRATVGYSIEVRGDDENPDFELSMREENGTWRACPLSG